MPNGLQYKNAGMRDFLGGWPFWPVIHTTGQILYRMLGKHDGAKRLAPRPGFPRRGIPDVGLGCGEAKLAPLFRTYVRKKGAQARERQKEVSSDLAL